MKIEVIKKKQTRLQSFFARPLTLKQRLQVKLAVLMFKIKTRSRTLTHDEKELIIECLESDILLTIPRENENPMYVAYAECRTEKLKSLIVRIRQDL